MRSVPYDDRVRTRFNSSQRRALLALEGGTLRRHEHGWLAEGEGGAQLLPDGVVRWLFGEGMLVRTEERATSYRLGERGEMAAREARREEESLAPPAADFDAELPSLLLTPAPHSEELDYLLLVPLGPVELERHRRRMRELSRLLPLERFEFVQFRDDLFALPISPRLAELDLLPRGEALFLEQGLRDATELGLRSCPDRGVNYGDGWLQWFGGFDPEAPLIITPRLAVAEFERRAGRSSRG